jgi:hypothetical protein
MNCTYILRSKKDVMLLGLLVFPDGEPPKATAVIPPLVTVLLGHKKLGLAIPQVVIPGVQLQTIARVKGKAPLLPAALLLRYIA